MDWSHWTGRLGVPIFLFALNFAMPQTRRPRCTPAVDEGPGGPGPGSVILTISPEQTFFVVSGPNKGKAINKMCSDGTTRNPAYARCLDDLQGRAGASMEARPPQHRSLFRMSVLVSFDELLNSTECGTSAALNQNDERFAA